MKYFHYTYEQINVITVITFKLRRYKKFLSFTFE